MVKKVSKENLLQKSRLTMEALEKAEEKLRYILDSMDEAYFETNVQGDFMFVNRSFCQTLGYLYPELQGMNYRIISTPETLKNIDEIRFNINESGKTQSAIVTDVIRKDGSRRNMEFSVSFTQDPSGRLTGFRGIGRDVTEKIRAARDIRHSEARYKILAENLTDVIWILDQDMKYIYISPSVKQLRGYTPDEVMKQTLDETLMPDSYRMAVEFFSREYKLEKSGQKHGKAWTKNLELEMRRKDGLTVWTEVKLNILYDDAGEAIGILGVTRDITERKKAEETLKKNEELYRTIFEHTATANMIVDEDMTILMVNSNFEEITGYTRSEVEHKMLWTKLVHTDDVEEMKDRHKLRRIDEELVPRSYEFKGITKSGEIRHIFMSASMIPNTRKSIASLIDISNRKKAEDALKQSEERFREMAELLPETVFDTDLDGMITFANETSFARFGYSPDDLAASLNILNMLAPESYEQAQTMFRNAIRGKEIRLTEIVAKRKDGTTFPALVHGSRILRDGQPVGVHGFLIDISEKKAMEEQLLRSQKMEAIGTLAGGIAHDFNNLLMGILGNLSLMLKDMDETHPFYRRIKNMEDFAQRGSDLTRQLLGFARGGKYEVKSTDLATFVRRSAEVFGRTKKEISIHHQTADKLRLVNVDRGQMDQVLLNLFMNAWQAMPGGGDLYLSLENTELGEENVFPFKVMPGKYVKLTVRDTGVGMDDDTKSHIFEPFFSTKERAYGTGLGLASVYGIVKNHAGYIWVESQQGAGSAFMIYLPASDQNIEEDTLKDGKIYKGKETILFIDDEEMLVEVGTEILKELGYEVLAATGGREGLKIFKQNKDSIDLVILDMIMPDMNGKKTFSELKRLKPSVNVLLSSGYSLDRQAKDFIKQGCKGFIQKPFLVTDLSKKVREILDVDETSDHVIFED